MIKVLNDWQWGYIAGILDGEGYFQIWLHKKDNTYHPKIRVRMTDKKTIYELLKITGIGIVNHYQPKGNRRRIYEWSILKWLEIRQLLNNVLSMLITKKKSAELLLDVIDLKENGVHKGEEMALLKKELQKLGKNWRVYATV
jgi:hypothetical protein